MPTIPASTYLKTSTVGDAEACCIWKTLALAALLRISARGLRSDWRVSAAARRLLPAGNQSPGGDWSCSSPTGSTAASKEPGDWSCYSPTGPVEGRTQRSPPRVCSMENYPVKTAQCARAPGRKNNNFTRTSQGITDIGNESFVKFLPPVTKNKLSVVKLYGSAEKCVLN